MEIPLLHTTFYDQFKFHAQLSMKNALYHNDPKFLDIQVWANSSDPDQTAPRGAV